MLEYAGIGYAVMRREALPGRMSKVVDSTSAECWFCLPLLRVVSADALSAEHGPAMVAGKRSLMTSPTLGTIPSRSKRRTMKTDEEVGGLVKLGVLSDIVLSVGGVWWRSFHQVNALSKQSDHG